MIHLTTATYMQLATGLRPISCWCLFRDVKDCTIFDYQYRAILGDAAGYTAYNRENNAKGFVVVPYRTYIILDEVAPKNVDLMDVVIFNPGRETNPIAKEYICKDSIRVVHYISLISTFIMPVL